MTGNQQESVPTGQPFAPDELSSGHLPRTFTGRGLQEIAFPLGGIGTGSVSLGGRGQLREWEIFNRPSKGLVLPYTFAAIWTSVAEGPNGPAAASPPQGYPARVQASDGPDGAPNVPHAAPPRGVARVLEARLQPPYSGGFGLPHATASGLPRLAEATFIGAYPYAWVEFEDDRLPVAVKLKAWNPLIPLEPEDSGLPVAVLSYTVRNPGPTRADVSISLSLMNPIGLTGTEGLDQWGRLSGVGGNVNAFAEEAGLRGLRLSSTKYDPEHPCFGTMALATTAQEVTCQTHWASAAWWGDILTYWDDFRLDGRLDDVRDCEPSGEGATHHGALCVSRSLAPGEEAELTFVLAWHFPNRVNTWNSEEQVRGKWLGNEYATRFADAWAAARYMADHAERLDAASSAYRDAMLDTTLPWYVVDAAMSNASTLKTTTCLRTADGTFHGFEGCHDREGCCPMDCTHVWNYEQATAFLFPSLAQSLRRTEFGPSLAADGGMGFRVLLPCGCQEWGGRAADGQMGCVLKLYRDWQLSGDDQILRDLWPGARRSLEFAWREGGWDGDQDGVMEGEQHNTYDVEFFGPNPMMGAWYLGALRAAAKMARAMDDGSFAAKCEDLAERGAAWLDANLFNGEYYEQQIGVPPGGESDPRMGPSWEEGRQEPRYQLGPGCLVDQLVGQYFCHVAGLGQVLDPAHVRETARSIFRYNFRNSLADHWNVQRTFALNDESALLICTWPRGGRPRYPFPYFTEVMTGFEYSAAVLMLYEGLLDEGLTALKAIRDRYNGENRNPWDEAECGHHYARAMASWAGLLALSGFQYSGVTGELTFAPKLNAADFRCFWSVPTGWGRFTQQASAAGQEVRIEVLHGSLRLRALRLELVEGEPEGEPQVTATVGRPVPVTAAREGRQVVARFEDTVELVAGGAALALELPRR